jgi:high-affinity Fe2+/Pb2+ permease
LQLLPVNSFSLLYFCCAILFSFIIKRRSANSNEKASDSDQTVKAMAPGAIQVPLAAQIRDRALWTIENTFTSLLLSILFLMTVKPNLLETVIMVSIGLIVGLLSTVRMSRVAPPATIS